MRNYAFLHELVRDYKIFCQKLLETFNFVSMCNSLTSDFPKYTTTCLHFKLKPSTSKYGHTCPDPSIAKCLIFTKWSLRF